MASGSCASTLHPWTCRFHHSLRSTHWHGKIGPLVQHGTNVPRERNPNKPSSKPNAFDPQCQTQQSSWDNPMPWQVCPNAPPFSRIRRTCWKVVWAVAAVPKHQPCFYCVPYLIWSRKNNSSAERSNSRDRLEAVHLNEPRWDQKPSNYTQHPAWNRLNMKMTLSQQNWPKNNKNMGTGNDVRHSDWTEQSCMGIYAYKNTRQKKHI